MKEERQIYRNFPKDYAVLTALSDEPAGDDEPQAEAGLLRSPDRARFWLMFRLKPATLGVLFCSGAVLAGVSYLLLSNHLITQGFALNQIKERVDVLAKTNRELELAVMQGESYEKISESIAKLQMVKAGDDVEYVEAKSKEVALR